ncbi:MAG: ABC transporter permease [Gammaproteobacteria bacterium]|nr:MAG: ABC transporter permease [Gammaproteobacteria bacterium]
MPLSVFIVVLWMLAGLLAPLLPLHPEAIHLDRILAPPWVAGGLGYDDLGRPLLDRLLMGTATSFHVAALTVSISAATGLLLGSLGGYLGGRFDAVLVRLIDVFLAFPGILLAIALAATLGPGIDNVVLALSVVGWVGFARLARAQALSVREREHVLAARALGTHGPWLLFRHVIPLVLTPVLVEATFGVASVIIAEAGLSFLGLGVQPPAASWGSMIREGTRYLLVAPHLVLVPGLALFLVVLAVNLAGDWLRDRLDVRLREPRP